MEESKDILKIGRDTILLESESLNKLSTLLDVHFSDVVSEIPASNAGAIAFASVDSYIMIANGTSWVSGQLV